MHWSDIGRKWFLKVFFTFFFPHLNSTSSHTGTNTTALSRVKRELWASVPSSELMNDAHHTSGVMCGRGLISCVSLTVPSGKPRAALDWLHMIPVGSSPPHLRLNCAAQPPDPTPSHFCPVRLCADIFIIKKKQLHCRRLAQILAMVFATCGSQ